MRVEFDRRLKWVFHGCKIASDAGFLAYRELDNVLGLTDLGGAASSDPRCGKNTRHLLTSLSRQTVFGHLAGLEDVIDAGRLSRDLEMRAIVDRKGIDRRAASTSQMGRFETAWLAMEVNLAALTSLSGTWSGASCVPAMFTAPRIGSWFSSLWSLDIGTGSCVAPSGRMPPSPSPRSTSS